MASQPGICLLPRQRNMLREGRRLLGLTLAQVSEQIGVHAPAVHRYEQGKSKPSIDVLRKWAAALGYRIEETPVEILPAQSGDSQ